MRLTALLERAGRWSARIVLICGAAVLFVLLILTCIDVFGRYLLNAPVNGKTELARFLMAGLIAFALPVVTATGQHITVDLLDRYFSGRLAALRNLAVDLICCVALFILSHWLVFRADRLYSRGYVSDFLNLPLYPVAYFVALMFYITAATLAVKLLLDGIYAVKPDLKPERAQDGEVIESSWRSS